jgi:hypothetical protein
VQKFYEELEEAGKNFEVVFVSRDRAPEDLKEYYNDHHGPWVYLEFGNPKIQSVQSRNFLNSTPLYNRELLEQFQVKTIPTCRVIKPDGTVVVVDARTEIQVPKKNQIQISKTLFQGERRGKRIGTLGGLDVFLRGLIWRG